MARIRAVPSMIRPSCTPPSDVGGAARGRAVPPTTRLQLATAAITAQIGTSRHFLTTEG
jgi:hypothetical protein